MSRCCAPKLSEQLVRLSYKLICLRATFSCPFTPFPSFINLIAHSLISLRLSPSLVLWPIPEGRIVKVSQPISVQLMYCPIPDTTSIVSHRTGQYSRAPAQWGWGMLWKALWSRLYWCGGMGNRSTNSSQWLFDNEYASPSTLVSNCSNGEKERTTHLTAA